MATIGEGRYELSTELARGAIGTVWRALDRTTGEPVAIKYLLPEAAAQPGLVAALVAEAQILTELDHPSVIRARDLVLSGDRYALVMDLVDGPDLRRALREEGAVPPAMAARIGAELADALDYLHRHGIVHGDVKPGNVLVPAGGGRVCLADFGAARRTLPVAGAVAPGERSATHGTPEYVSPEVIAGDPPRPPADLYALGVVLYELLTGRSPFRGGTAGEVLARHGTCAAVPVPGMPESLWPVIESCLAPDPARRPDSATVARQLRAALPALDGLPPLPTLGPDVITWWPRTVEETVPVPASRRRAVWVPAGTAPVSPGPAGSGSPAGVLLAAAPGTAVAPGTGAGRASAAAPWPVTPPAPTTTGPGPRRTPSPGGRPPSSSRRRRIPRAVALAGGCVVLLVVLAAGVLLLVRGAGARGPAAPVAVLDRASATPSTGSPAGPSTGSGAPGASGGPGAAAPTGGGSSQPARTEPAAPRATGGQAATGGGNPVRSQPGPTATPGIPGMGDPMPTMPAMPRLP